MRQKDFFITNIYSLRNHKILTNFFVVTNTLIQGTSNREQWDWLHFFSRNNGCFGLKLSESTCPNQLSEINRKIFSLNNRCYGHHKNTIFLVSMRTISRTKIPLLLKKLGQWTKTAKFGISRNRTSKLAKLKIYKVNLHKVFIRKCN